MDSTDVGRLLSLISHEVRGPLGVMLGYLRLLEQRGPDLAEPHRQAVTAALRAGDRAAELLAQVSLLGQVARRETPLDLQVMAVADALSLAARAVRLPEDPKVTLTIATQASGAVRADAALLVAALTGVISAVVRAQPSDVAVIINTHEQPRNDAHGVAIHITVNDTESASEHPVDVTRGGLGLDLPVALAVVVAHGGELRERRSGTQLVGMVVWLPLAQ